MKDLEVGYEFPIVSYVLTQSTIAKYREAVEARSATANFIPPLAIAAYAMRAMSQSFPLPPGAIHAAQELEFVKPVTVGSHINCQSRVLQKISRAGLNMVVIELSTFDQVKQRFFLGERL